MSQKMINEKYEIQELLGEGAFGTIYLVKISKTGEQAAVKVFKNYQQFLNEKKIWEMCGDVCGLVKILDCFAENDTGFLVMEYLSGGTLKNYIEKKRNGKNLKLSENIKLLQPVMEALHMLHGKGIIHCDVSPDNIMFGEDGKVKLIDLGAARRWTEEYAWECSEKNSITERILKERYAAPEQYANPEKQGPWTDVYGMCAVLYEMLTDEKMISSTVRMKAETLVDLRLYDKKEYKAANSVMRGLQLEIQKRFFSMAVFMDSCGLSIEEYKNLDGIIRHRWGSLWIQISAQGKFASSAEHYGKRTRIFKKRIKAAGMAAVFLAVMMGGFLYYQTHFQEKKFEDKLKAAMNTVQQSADMDKLNVMDEDFKEKIQYLQEYGVVEEEQEDAVYYSLEEDEFLKWGVKSNKCRKMYLDYETLKDACFYYLDVEKSKIKSNENKFTSSIYWTKGDFQSLDVVGKKTESWNWGDSLEIEYDAVDKRVFSVCLTTDDEGQLQVFLEEILKLCCPETYLKDEEIEKITDMIKAGDEDVSVMCLNEKAWLWGFGYELGEVFYYQCELTASKGTMWN